MRYFRVDRRDIAYFRFILEAYDGLASLSTVDAREGIVALSIPESLADDANALLNALAGEFTLTDIPDFEDLHHSTPQETHDDA